jgi:hypothetical protein
MESRSYIMDLALYTSPKCGAGAGRATMLAHVKRIGTPPVTVAPFFHDFHYLTINHLFCTLRDSPLLPLTFTFEDNLA